MIEIRSYRRVFELERRIYRIDRLRLNPAGVPVRGIVYFLVLFAAGALISAMPLASIVAAKVPWYLRGLVLPAGTAALLTVIRLEGRPFHLGAQALLRSSLQARRVAGLRAPARLGMRWRPPELVFLPDGSDGRVRRLRYTGPGAALVAVEHERVGPARIRGLGGLCAGPRRPALRVRELPGALPLQEGRVIVLVRGASLSVHPSRARRT